MEAPIKPVEPGKSPADEDLVNYAMSLAIDGKTAGVTQIAARHASPYKRVICCLVLGIIFTLLIVVVSLLLDVPCCMHNEFTLLINSVFNSLLEVAIMW